MSKILDLSVYAKDTLDIKLPDGSATIHVLKPTKQLTIKLIAYETKMQELMKVKDTATDDDAKKVIDDLQELTINILNNNDDNIKVTDEYMEDNKITYSLQLVIFQGYLNFMNELVSDPNLKSPRTHTKRK